MKSELSRLIPLKSIEDLELYLSLLYRDNLVQAHHDLKLFCILTAAALITGGLPELIFVFNVSSVLGLFQQ